MVRMAEDKNIRVDMPILYIFHVRSDGRHKTCVISTGVEGWLEHRSRINSVEMVPSKSIRKNMPDRSSPIESSIASNHRIR